MITVCFTDLQLEEITHKLSILAEEADLQESYEISEDEAKSLYNQFYSAKNGYVSFDEKYADIIIGEIEDRMEALYDNWQFCGDEEEGYVHGQMQQALRKIKLAMKGK